MQPNSFTSKFLASVLASKNEGNITLSIFGMVNSGIMTEYIYFVQPRRRYPAHLPQLLIAGGFHGEESAGPLAILQFIENAPSYYFEKANLSFLPCVNPIGFNNNTHYAIEGIKTNCGFCHPENGDQLSIEGKILMKYKDPLIVSSKEGFLSLHEDIKKDKFYIYSLGADDWPNEFAIAMRDEGMKYFPLLPDGETVNFEWEPALAVWDGFVHNFHDGGLEDFLFHEGCANSVAIEAPAKDISLDRRVEASVALIKKFIELSIEGEDK